MPIRDLMPRRLNVEGVDKSFADRLAVKGASIPVERGEAVALLGPNGAGKTTIFHMIAGLVRPDRGLIAVDGHDITGLPMYQRARPGIGYLPQQASIPRGRSVGQSIRAVLDMVEPDQRQREHRLDALLEELDIARLRNWPSDALSGGELRRVEIARAMATQPFYMLLDELFAEVETAVADDILAVVRRLAKRGIGVLIADQLNRNPRQTLDVSDRAYVICSGDGLGTLVI
jgi:lipopolysaccharide export system ATP-binding protein